MYISCCSVVRHERLPAQGNTGTHSQKTELPKSPPGSVSMERSVQAPFTFPCRQLEERYCSMQLRFSLRRHARVWSELVITPSNAISCLHYTPSCMLVRSPEMRTPYHHNSVPNAILVGFSTRTPGHRSGDHIRPKTVWYSEPNTVIRVQLQRSQTLRTNGSMRFRKPQALKRYSPRPLGF